MDFEAIHWVMEVLTADENPLIDHSCEKTDGWGSENFTKIVLDETRKQPRIFAHPLVIF